MVSMSMTRLGLPLSVESQTVSSTIASVSVAKSIAQAMVLAMLVLAMDMEDTDLDTDTEAMVLDMVWDSTERERPSLVMDMVTMARGGDMDTEPEDTTMARGRPSLVTTRTGAMATGPGATMVIAPLHRVYYG